MVSPTQFFALLHLLIDALRRSPEPAWRWAVVQLMGHTTLHGQVSGVEGPAFRVRVLQPDGSMRDGVYARGALFWCDFYPEHEVRAGMVRDNITRHRCCETFRPSPVLSELCLVCACTLEQHDERREKEAGHDATQGGPWPSDENEDDVLFGDSEASSC